ncbi:PMT-domain-containing protein [Ramicandelaber brevisporus]|nr:PMT-domain-containing protein [Ramicandelaber brevisporus]
MDQSEQLRQRRVADRSASSKGKTDTSSDLEDSKKSLASASATAATASSSSLCGLFTAADGSPLLDATQLALLVGLTLLACWLRLWRIENPSAVVFDEVHFGKFAGKYINQTFYFDVHPNLAKMMFAWAGKAVGYNGTFDFKDIGLDYHAAEVPYVGMRMMPAILGALTVPMAFMTVRASGHSLEAGILAALLVAYENSMITQFRLILLDAALLFFTALTITAWSHFHAQQRRPFTFAWWTWLALTGAGWGLTASCKWVGLFTMATIGLSTLKDLWTLACDKKVTMTRFAQHFVARAICLIAIPLAIYAFIFQIHFWTVYKSGDGDGFMSAEFQSTLVGNTVSEHAPRDVYYGAHIQIRHVATNEGWLHSHAHSYPDGSKQQQITLYPHKDENNWWRIERTPANAQKWVEKHGDPVTAAAAPPEPLRSGDVIRLVHTSTNRRLHSHNVRAPVTKHDYHNEVSGYGWQGFEGDANDDFRIEVVETEGETDETRGRVLAFHSKFRIIHQNTGCAMYSNSKKLPDWGFGQAEVSCMTSAKVPKTTWRIDGNRFEGLPAGTPMVTYKPPGLIKKLIEINSAMMRVNNGLTSSHPFESRAYHWPLALKGIAFWGHEAAQIHLIGNPVIYWATFASVVFFGVIQVVLHFIDIRGIKSPIPDSVRSMYTSSVGFYTIGWFIHLFPFFIMARQLFLHHYIPALYLAILGLVTALDSFTARVSRKFRWVIFGLVFLSAWWSYAMLKPIIYGTSDWTKQSCERAKWVKSWAFDCERIREYPPSSPATISPAITSAPGAEQPAPAPVAPPAAVEQAPAAAPQEPAIKASEAEPVAPAAPAAAPAAEQAPIVDVPKPAADLARRDNAGPPASIPKDSPVAVAVIPSSDKVEAAPASPPQEHVPAPASPPQEKAEELEETPQSQSPVAAAADTEKAADVPPHQPVAPELVPTKQQGESPAAPVESAEAAPAAPVAPVVAE